MKSVRIGLGLLLVQLFYCPIILAQATFASITGTVTDEQGLVIPGVFVEVTDVERNYKYTAHSNDVGVFTFAKLLEGRYVLIARADGFKEFVARDIQLSARDVRRLDISLELGEQSIVIEVSAGGGGLIETDTARIADIKKDELLKSLPMNTRNMQAFLELTAGVFPTNVNGVATVRFAGSRTGQEGYSLDGLTFANGWDATPVPVHNFMESFQELKVDLANNSAEFGSIGLATIVTKSGTNDIHGSLFDYYTTSGLNARNAFAPTRGSFVRHSLGGSIGGPVVLPGIYDGRDKTFFFFSLESLRGGEISQLLNPTVALPAWRNGDFSGLAPLVIRDPITKQPFPGNRIPESRINPVARRIQERFWPLPNFGDTSALRSQNYRELKRRPFDPSTLWTPRIDHRFSDRLFVFGRFTRSWTWVRPFDGNLPSIGQSQLLVDGRHLAISGTYVANPSLVNEFAGGVAWRSADRHPAPMGKQLVTELGLEGLASDLPDIQGIPTISFAGIGLTGTSVSIPWLLSRWGPNYEFRDNLTWMYGRHSLKAGVQVSRIDFLFGQSNPNLFGGLVFSNRFTGHPYADFLLGVPTSSARSFSPIVSDLRRWAYDVFINDDIKVTRRLTLNLGLRYEVHPAWHARDGRISAFDIDSGKIVVPDGSRSLVSKLMPSDYVGVIEAGEAGYDGKTLIRTDRNNVAPRIGVAYRPWGNTTVFRGGYGIYYDTVARTSSFTGAPFQLTEPAFVNPADNPQVILPKVFLDSGSRPSSVSLPSAIRRDLRVPYSMQYNVTIEHQRWETGLRLSYIGTNTRQGEWSYNINQPVPDQRLYVDKARLFPRFPAIAYITNGAGHQYHSLVAEARRRAGDLVYQATYSLARDIQDLERGQAPENAYDRRRERSVWIDIPTHRITGYFTYDLPVGRGKKLLAAASSPIEALLGGWQLGGVLTYRSGQFLTPLWTGPDPTGTFHTASRTSPVVTIRPDQVQNPNLPENQRTAQRWFDPTAFARPSLGFFGSAAKGVIKGPDAVVLNLGLSKSFKMGESMTLRAEITATNLPNHTNLGNPGTNISAATAVGVISSAGEARSVRMGFRLEW